MKKQPLTTMQRCAGFSMLEVTMALVVLSGMAVMLLPSRESAPSYVREEDLLQLMDRQLWYFIARNSRLPCPDVNGNGHEQCGSTAGKGYVPFRTLGMNAGAYGLADAPVMYSVYRRRNNSTDTAGAFYRDTDLALGRNRFEPTMAGGEAVALGNVGASDFCAALSVAADQSFSPSHTFVQDSDGQRRNVAFAIASPGAYNSDGEGAIANFSPRFDALNASSWYGFNSDNTPVSRQYDDRVISRDFTELSDSLQCPELMESMNLMANGRQSEMEVTSSLADNTSAAIRGSVINSIGFISNGVDLVQSGFAVVNPTVHLATAVGLLAASIASCVTLVGCAQIPARIASVAAATAGLATGTLALGFTAGATATQVAGTTMYIYVAATLGLEDGDFGEVDVSDNINTLQNDLASAQQERAELAQQAATADANFADQEALVSTQRGALESYARNTADPALIGDPPVIGAFAAAEAALALEQQRQAEFNDANSTYQSANDTCEAISGGSPSLPEGDDAIDLPEGIDYSDVTYDGDPAESDACIAANDSRADWLAARDAYEAQQEALQLSVIAARDSARIHQVYDAAGVLQGECQNLAGCTLDYDWYREETVGENQVPTGFYGELRKLAGLRQERDRIRDQLNDQDNVIAELSGSLGAMQCIADGLSYDQANDTCVAQDDLGEATGLTLAPGAEAILRHVEQRALVMP